MIANPETRRAPRSTTTTDRGTAFQAVNDHGQDARATNDRGTAFQAVNDHGQDARATNNRGTAFQAVKDHGQDARATTDDVRATAARRKIRAEKERFGAHPLWRRVTGLTFPQEQFVHGRERRRGIHQVIRWLEKHCGVPSGGADSSDVCAPQAQEALPAGASCGLRPRRQQVVCATRGTDMSTMPISHGVPHDTAGRLAESPAPEGATRFFACPEVDSALAGAAREGSRGTQRPSDPAADAPSPAAQTAVPDFAAFASWRNPVPTPAEIEQADAQRFAITAPLQPTTFEMWPGVNNADRSLQSLCVELQISRSQLNALTQEYCGLSAQDFLDGFRVQRLRGALNDRLRNAARELWGSPGNFVYDKLQARLAEMKADRPSLLSDPRRRGPAAPGWAHRRGACATYQSRVPDHWRRDRNYEFEDRTEQLAAALRKNFDYETWAMQLGFGTPARVRRACLNSLGRSLRQLEKILANEVVQYYIAAEDKMLRQLASVKGNSQTTVLARDLYGCVDDPPEPPFMDSWSKYEYFKREWLTTMQATFG